MKNLLFCSPQKILQRHFFVINIKPKVLKITERLIFFLTTFLPPQPHLPPGPVRLFFLPFQLWPHLPSVSKALLRITLPGQFQPVHPEAISPQWPFFRKVLSPQARRIPYCVTLFHSLCSSHLPIMHLWDYLLPIPLPPPSHAPGP